MEAYKNILVPLDGSKLSEAVLPEVTKLAGAIEAHVTILRVAYNQFADKEKVMGEVGLMFIGYNLTRCVSVLGFDKLLKLLRECRLFVFNSIKRLIFSPFNEFYFYCIKIPVQKKHYPVTLKTCPWAFYA